MTSDTPETDAFIECLNDDWDVEFATLTAHAKKLERERNDARNLLREARDKCYRLRRDRLAITRSYLDVSEMLDNAMDGLKEIAKMDTSQDASPQQCGAVLIAMNTLQELK